MTPVLTLFAIIFLEGYVVLSTELLAIRLLIPFTGSGTDTISIIIAAILMPLAFGYFAGGRFSDRQRKRSSARSVRDRLILNLVVAAAILTPGLSYVFIEWGFENLLIHTNISNRLLITALYAGLFLVWPVYLLGQTVPLISNYFSRQHLPVLAGRILFFSTMGSFMGAVFCTLVLMTFLGVNHAATITIGCMTALVFVLSRKKISRLPVLALVCFALSALLNSGMAMKRFDVVDFNRYSLIQIEDNSFGDLKALRLNRSFASIIYKFSKEPYSHYIAYLDEVFLQPIRQDGPVRDILILGSGGFVAGRTDTKNNYTYVDIDGALKDIAEKDFLQEKLTPNKKFVPLEARAFLMQDKNKYDLIFLDLYRDQISAPEYLITREFYAEVKDHLKDGGIMVGNYISSPLFSDNFSIRLDSTLRSVFPHLNRQTVSPFNGWQREDDWRNVMYIYIHNPAYVEGIYTDNKNSSPFDRRPHLPNRPTK